MYDIRIDKERCARCGKCSVECPSFVLNQQVRGGDVEVLDASRCIVCGHCVDVCGNGAMVHEAFPPERVHKINVDCLPSPGSLLELMRSRRSNRSITDEELTQHDIEMIMDAARCAPTAENSRNVTVRLLSDPKVLQTVEDAVMDYFARLVRLLMLPPVKFVLKPFLNTLYGQAEELMRMDEKRKAGARPATINAKAILLITAPKDSRFGYQDCNLAYQNASLMAQSLGISQVYLGFVQTAFGMWGTKKTSRLLGIEPDQKVFALMALGKPSVRYVNYTLP